MKKNMKYIILAICVIIIIIACVVTFNIKNNSENANAQVENEITNTIVEENIVNEIANTMIEEANKIEEQNIVDTQQIPEESTSESDGSAVSTVYEQDNDIGSTDKKQEAINLVKEKWGQDDTVTFRCDSITSNGEYIIAVISKDSAKVKNYFRVNLAEKKVVVDY